MVQVGTKHMYMVSGIVLKSKRLVSILLRSHSADVIKSSIAAY